MDLFFKNFEQLTDAPNGVQKLRELILQLAVQGKLVPQDPYEDSADHLLKLISQKLHHDSLKNKITIEKLSLKEIPYRIPETWVWVRLDSICKIIGGGTPKTNNPAYFSDSEIPWLTPADLYNLKEKYIGSGRRFISYLGLQKSSARLLPKGSVLFSSRAPIGYTAIAKNDLCTNQGFKSCIPYIMETNLYIYYFFKNIAKQIDKDASGTTFKEVSGRELAKIKVPLPPLKEQKRIVAKVDQLMALCDALEKQKEQRAQKRVSMHKAAIHHLLESKVQAEFNANWRRIRDHFDLLYDVPENVAQLKQAILQLAVQGKLTAEWRSSHPELVEGSHSASVLLDKIKAEKALRQAQDKKRKEKPLPPIGEGEKPYELPRGWEWVRISDLVKKVGSGSTPKGGRSVYSNDGVKFLRSQNVWNEGLRLENIVFISEEINNKMKGTVVKPNDILLNITGASIGRCSIVPGSFDIGNVNQHVSIIRLVNQSVKEFIHICLISPYLQNFIMEVQVGMSREGLSKSKIEKFVIPFPPFEEQKRIVAKVDALMRLCDGLEEKLSESQQQAGRLMNAVARGLLGG